MTCSVPNDEMECLTCYNNSQMIGEPPGQCNGTYQEIGKLTNWSALNNYFTLSFNLFPNRVWYVSWNSFFVFIYYYYYVFPGDPVIEETSKRMIHY